MKLSLFVSSLVDRTEAPSPRTKGPRWAQEPEIPRKGPGEDKADPAAAVTQGSLSR